MAYDLEEQEQIATFKAFWSKYGNIITWVLILALGSYAAYNFWNSHKRSQATEASALYDELQASLEAKDNAKVQRVAGDIQAKYEGTAYAPMAALAGAKAAFDANDLKTAKAQLQWAVDHGNDEYKSIAKLRLSGVLLDEKAYDQALKLLGTDFLPQFAAEVNDRKGDVLVALRLRGERVERIDGRAARHQGQHTNTNELPANTHILLPCSWIVKDAKPAHTASA